MWKLDLGADKLTRGLKEKENIEMNYRWLVKNRRWNPFIQDKNIQCPECLVDRFHKSDSLILCLKRIKGVTEGF